MGNRRYFESESATTVNGSWTTLATDAGNGQALFLSGIRGTTGTLNIEVEVAGGGDALDGFAIQLKDHSQGEWYDYLVSSSAGSGDFDSTLSNLPFATDTGPHEVAAGNRAHAIARVHAAHACRFRAKSSGSSDVTVRGSLVTD